MDEIVTLSSPASSRSSRLRFNYSDLPDVPSLPGDDAPDTGSAEPGGNEHSRSQTHAAIAATPTELRRRPSDTTLTDPISAMAPGNGKLKRKSTATSPPYRNPTAPSAQHKLPSQRPRGDLFEVEPSPEKERIKVPKLPAKPKALAQISPLRKQKAAARRAKTGEPTTAAQDPWAETQRRIDEQIELESRNIGDEESEEDPLEMPRFESESQYLKLASWGRDAIHAEHNGKSASEITKFLESSLLEDPPADVAEEVVAEAADAESDSEGAEALPARPLPQNKRKSSRSEGAMGEQKSTTARRPQGKPSDIEEAPAVSARPQVKARREARQSKQQVRGPRAIEASEDRELHSKDAPAIIGKLKPTAKRGPRLSKQSTASAAANGTGAEEAAAEAPRPRPGGRHASPSIVIPSPAQAVQAEVSQSSPGADDREEAGAPKPPSRAGEDVAGPSETRVPKVVTENPAKQAAQRQSSKERRNQKPKTQRHGADKRSVVIRPEDMQFDGPMPASDEDEELPPYYPTRNQAPAQNVDRSEDDESEDEEAGPSTQLVNKRKSKKRKAAETAPVANTKAKRAKRQSYGDDELSVSDDDEADEPQNLDGNRFYGQYEKLQGVWRTAGRMLRESHVLEDEVVKPLVESCNNIQRLLGRLQEAPEAETEDAMATDLENLYAGLQKLYKQDGDEVPDFTDKQRSLDLHGHLFPTLALLLRDWIRCYTALDDLPNVRVTDDHLKQFVKLVAETRDLGKGAETYIRPATEYAVVQPVKNRILVPLRETHRALRTHSENQARAARVALERALSTQRQQATRIREERERAIAAQLLVKKKEWDSLHVLRREVDGHPSRNGNYAAQRERAAFLRCPDPPIDEDHNGEAFTRVSVFGPRVGPTPEMIQNARNKVWSLVEIATLLEGLKRYAPRGLCFQRVIARYCNPPGGLPRGQYWPDGHALHAYSVTDIVVIAADLKRHYINAKGDAVEEWWRQVPEWVPAAGEVRGQENWNADVRESIEVDEEDGEGAGG